MLSVWSRLKDWISFDNLLIGGRFIEKKTHIFIFQPSNHFQIVYKCPQQFIRQNRLARINTKCAINNWVSVCAMSAHFSTPLILLLSFFLLCPSDLFHSFKITVFVYQWRIWRKRIFRPSNHFPVVYEYPPLFIRQNRLARMNIECTIIK